MFLLINQLYQLDLIIFCSEIEGCFSILWWALWRSVFTLCSKISTSGKSFLINLDTLLFNYSSYKLFFNIIVKLFLQIREKLVLFCQHYCINHFHSFALRILANYFSVLASCFWTKFLIISSLFWLGIKLCSEKDFQRVLLVLVENCNFLKVLIG